MSTARSFAAAVVGLSIVALAAGAAAQSKTRSQLLPNATVKSVSPASIVVTTLGKDMTFTVDAKTQVVGKGIGTKSKAKGDKPSIGDLVKEGDRVTVTYQDMSGTMHASKIEVAARGGGH
jgi:hypothetical protein